MDAWSNDEWPEWESLSYVADNAYEQLAGDAAAFYDAMEVRGHHSPTDPNQTGKAWDFEDPAEAARRLPLPRLSRPFPLTDRAIRDRRGREVVERMLAERDPREHEALMTVHVDTDDDLSGCPV